MSAAERADLIDSHRLVYRADSMVNWCPGLGTVLANEEVTSDGRSDRGNFPVFRKRLRQWMMRITAYSDRLLDDLVVLDWPDKVKAMQRNWIGRSTGAEVLFGTDAGDIEVFTTRPDTLFGATYMVLAPEHPLVEQLTASEWPDGVDARWTNGAATPAEAVADYRAAIAAKSDLERQENKTKTGVFLGAYATNPVNGATHPGLHRRLRPCRIRHRRHHGGARRRPARLGLRHANSGCRSSKSLRAAIFHRRPTTATARW